MNAPAANERRTLGALAPWLTLALLWLARGAAPLSHTMAAWGLNVARFLPAWAGWGAWALSGLALLPRAGRAAATGLERVQGAARGRAARLALALAVALLVFALPDRTWLTGDFMLRQGAVGSNAFETSFVNALPLERLLDHLLPGIASPDSAMDPSPATRVFEAGLAGVLTLLAFALAGAWGLAGPARAAAVGTVACSGALVAFTGLGKPTALMCVLVAACLLAATRLQRERRGGLAFGLSLGLALFTHRVAVMLLPLGVLVGARAVREVRARRMGRGQLFGTIAVPLGAAAFIAPRLARIFSDFDLPRHVAPGGVHGLAAVAALLAPLRLLDLANAALLLAPALPVALVLARPGRARGPDDGGAGPALTLALSALSVFVLVRPIQGVFRDIEVFVPAALAITLWCGRQLGAALRDRRAVGWLAPAMLAGSIVPSLQWLAHYHDGWRGFERARSFASERPTRDASEAGQIWDVLAYRAFRLRTWPEALIASRAAAACTPSKRAQLMWAMARSETGDVVGAESVYVALAGRYPEDPVVWLGLGGAAMRAGDALQARRAMAQLDAYRPGSPQRRIVQQTVRAFPEMWPPLSGGARP